MTWAVSKLLSLVIVKCLHLLVNAIYVLYGFDTSPSLRLKLENVKDNIQFQKSSFSFLEIFLFLLPSKKKLADLA